MPSPNCQVKDGAGAYGPTTNGVNVTPANTITINLISSAGVSVWSISCITTDDTSSASAVTAALVIDSVAKTATFTAPAAGKAYRFQSQINGGIGPDGTALSSYTTTFCIYTPVAGSGLRVHALDETFEAHATFGWLADLNSLIRNPPGTVFTSIQIQDLTLTDQFIIQSTAELAADRTCLLPGLTGNDTFVFEAHTQTLTNKTLTTPTLTTPTLTTPKISDSAGGQFYNFAVSNLGADRTVTLPLLIGNDTFVFEAHTQSLSNKTLVLPKILDSGADHSYIFAVSNLAADRTVTWPLLGANDTLVFEAHTQTLSGKTLATPTITGAITISSYSSTTTTSNDGKVVVIDAIGSVQTTDATVTSAYTSGTLTDEAVHTIDVVVTAIKSDGSAAAQYKRHYAGRRDGGTWTELAAVADDKTEETTSTWDVTVDVSSNTFRVRVTGVAANTIRWGYAIRHQSTVP